MGSVSTALRRHAGECSLGQLVEADVQRAREATAESDAVAAVRAIRAHADELEKFIREPAPSSKSAEGSLRT